MSKWLPSRHRFALTRLMAFVLLRAADAGRVRAGRRDGGATIYAVDRDQNAVEPYSLSVLYVVLTVGYLAAFFPWWGAILLAPFAIQLPMSISGAIVLPLWRNNLTVHSRLMMTLLIAASIYIRSWLAWAFLALVAANAVAAVVMFLLRDRVKELERRCAA